MLNALKSYYAHGGVRAISALAQGKLFRNNPEIQVKISELKHPVWLRVSTSDVEVFQQVLTNQEYEVSCGNVLNTIIDAGANAGFASIFYANKYPKARIFAIEVAEANFRVLAKNVAPYKNIIPIHAALWSAEGQIGISGREHGYWGFRVLGSSEMLKETVPAITVNGLMNRYNIEYIDLLKIDIEGAEKEVLENSGTWIDKVGAIAIETHDRFKPGCTEALNRAAIPFHFRRTKGEIKYFARTAPI
jgi:FkbM family methyltransferase